MDDKKLELEFLNELNKFNNQGEFKVRELVKKYNQIKKFATDTIANIPNENSKYKSYISEQINKISQKKPEPVKKSEKQPEKKKEPLQQLPQPTFTVEKTKTEETANTSGNVTEYIIEDEIIKLQLNLDSIISSNDFPVKKKEKLVLVINYLKKKIKEHESKITREIFEENLKKNLPKTRVGTSDNDLFETFRLLIDKIFENKDIIKTLVSNADSINGGVPKPGGLEIYETELDKAKKIKSILNRIEELLASNKLIGTNIDNKIIAVKDTYAKKLQIGDLVKCSYKIAKSKNGIIKDINYIPGKLYGYTVELTLKNDSNEDEIQNLSSCNIFTTEEKIKEKKREEEQEQKTNFLTKQIAKRYGFEIGDSINCINFNGNRVSGIATKFKHNILKNKTYILVKEKDKTELTEIGVKYCTNQFKHKLIEINAKKEKEYLSVQFKKLLSIINNINKLSPNDEEYEYKLKNLNNEYILIKDQINKTMESKSNKDCKDGEVCSESTEESGQQVSEIYNDEYNKLVRIKTSLVRELSKIQSPEEFQETYNILKLKPSGGNSFEAKQKEPTNKYANLSKLIVKGGYKTIGVLPKHVQRAGQAEETMSDLTSYSNNLLTLMDKMI